MKRLLSVLLAALLMIPLCAVTAEESPAPQDVLMEQVLSAEDPAQAAQAVLEAAEKADGDPEMLMLCAQMLFYLNEEGNYTQNWQDLLLAAAECADEETPRSAIFSAYLAFTAMEDESRIQEAIDTLSASWPDDPDLNGYRAGILLQDGRTEEASAIADAMIDSGTNTPQALLLKGEVLLRTWRWDEALDVFEQAETQAEDPTQALYGQYRALRGAGEFVRASRRLDQLITRTDDDDLWLERAQLSLWQMLDPEDALAQLEALLRKNDAWPQALNARTAALLMLRRYDEAVENAGLYTGPVPEDTKLMQALALLDSDRYDESLALLDELLASETVSCFYPLYHAAALYEARCDGEAMLPDLHDALEQGAEGISSFWMYLGHANRVLGRGEQAARCYRKASELTDDDPSALYYLAIVFMEAGETGLLESTVADMETRYPGWYDTILMRMLTEDLLGHADAALESWDALAAKFPFPARELWSLHAELLASAGKTDEAAERWNAGYAEYGAETDDWCGLAFIRLSAGDTDAAREALDSAWASLGDDSSRRTRAQAVSCHTSEAFLALTLGDPEGCRDWLEKACGFGFVPGELLHWSIFASFLPTEACRSLLSGWDAAAGTWDLTAEPDRP